MRASEAAVSTVSDVVHRLGADTARGLGESQVSERRQLHGYNEFEIKEEDPLWRKYLNQVWFVLVGVSVTHWSFKHEQAIRNWQCLFIAL